MRNVNNLLTNIINCAKDEKKKDIIKNINELIKQFAKDIKDTAESECLTYDYVLYHLSHRDLEKLATKYNVNSIISNSSRNLDSVSDNDKIKYLYFQKMFSIEQLVAYFDSKYTYQQIKFVIDKMYKES